MKIPRYKANATGTVAAIAIYSAFALTPIHAVAQMAMPSSQPQSPLEASRQAPKTQTQLKHGEQQTWAGEITTAMCKTTRGSMGHDCILNCVKAGEKFVLATKNQLLDIRNQDFIGLADKAGHRVTLTGSIAPGDKAITVTKIEMAGSSWHRSRSPQ